MVYQVSFTFEVDVDFTEEVVQEYFQEILEESLDLACESFDQLEVEQWREGR